MSSSSSPPFSMDRPLVLDEYAGRTKNVFMRHPGTFCGLSLFSLLLPVVPTYLFLWMFAKDITSILPDISSEPDDQGEQPDWAAIAMAFVDTHAHNFLKFMVINMFLTCIFTIAGRGAIIRAATEVHVGSTPTVFRSLEHGGRRFCALFCAGALKIAVVLGLEIVMGILFHIVMLTNSFSLIVSVALFLYTMFYVGVIFISLVWFIAIPIVMVEQMSPVPAVKRAIELTQNRRLTIFGALFAWGLFCFIIEIAWQSFCSVFPHNHGVFALRFLPSLFLFAFYAILQTVVYLNLRVDKESMNLSVLKAQVEGTQPLVAGTYAPVCLEEVEHGAGGNNDSMEAPLTENAQEVV